MQRLKISREGVILIKSFEGFRPRAIRRANGQWVIGYGHTASAREGASVSEAEAELLLQYDLIPIAKALNEGVAARLNQHQFDALASFAYSVGLERFEGSNVLSRLNAGFAGEAADALVGWPEPILPETSIRRRAAERALFVADPAGPVTLSDLLVAPLPTPEPEPESVKAEAEPEVDVRETPSAPAASAEASPTLHQPEPPQPEATTVLPAELTSFAPTAAPLAYPAAQAIQRYSAYAGAIVGPLPAPATRAALAPVEVAQDTPPELQSTVEPTASATGQDAVVSDELPTSAELEAVDPFPGADGEPAVVLPDFTPSTIEPAAPPAPWSTITAASEPRTDGELTLTSPTEDEVVATPRQVWAQEDQASGEGLPMFEDDGTLRTAQGNILRHEPFEKTPPANIPWGELGAYGLMGAFGLVSFGMSMAAFRRASQTNAYADGTTVIAIVLAVIGAACVGVSAYNLYRRWGRADEA